MASSILTARLIGPEGKGNFELLLATTSLLTITLGFSLPSGVTFVVARRRANLHSLTLGLTYIALLKGLLSVGTLYALGHTSYLSSFLPNDAKHWYIAGISFYVFLIALSNFWTAILIGSGEISQANKYSLFAQIFQLTLLFVLAILLYTMGNQISVPVLFQIKVLTSIVLSIFLLRTIFISVSIPDYNTSGIREAIYYAIPCYFANLAQFINYRLDIFIVGFFSGPKSVGLYALATSITELIWLSSNSAAAVLLPKIAASHDDLSKTTHTAQMCRLALWTSVLSSLFLALFAGKVLPWMYGEAFRQSVAPLLWLLPGVVAFSTVNILAAYIAGIGKPGLNFLVSLTGVFVTITLDFILIPYLDITGAAIASSVSYSISAFLTALIFVMKSGGRLINLIVLRSEDIRFIALVAGRILKYADHTKVA